MVAPSIRPISREPVAQTTTAAAPEELERSRRRTRFRYTLPGAWVAIVFGCLAFTPSLLPRSPILQGALCGITAAIGYGIGVAGAWVWRAFADREEKPARRNSWRWFAVVAPILAVLFWLAGRYWQGEIRDFMDAEAPGVLGHVLLPVVAILLFVAIIAAARALRRLYRWLARTLERWIGPKAAKGIGWAVVVLGTYIVVSGLLLGGLVDLANQSFSVANGDTQEGVVQPTTSFRSGGPDSIVSWESLGREGRAFMGKGPAAEDISALTGEPALDPIRAFAGLESADSTEARAELAVADLERAGGFDRQYLMVATTTGSGWVSPGGADSFEYLTGGDSAIVAIQYSYLPSWISYLVDQAKAREAGRELFDAVYERWLQVPEATRPKLIVFGESLGTFGGEAAFSGERDLANRTSGALLTGPPNFNTLHEEFTGDRDPGSTELAPVYRDGRIVRFENEADGVVDPVSEPWDGTRVLYVQHASDPIVWWSPQLILNEPDWLNEPIGADVVSDIGWLPFVTFWQISADLPAATAVPPGHGHLYTEAYVPGWVDVLQPTGWTEDELSQLQDLIVAE